MVAVNKSTIQGLEVDYLEWKMDLLPGVSVELVEILPQAEDLSELYVKPGMILELDNVEVVRARAEELHGHREFSVVTSRAVAPLDRLLGWSMPLVRLGGALVAMKGSSVQEEIVAAEKALRRYGAGEVTVVEYGSDLIDPPTTVLRVEATRPSRLGLDAQRPARSARRATKSPTPRTSRTKKGR